jgi:hypothetical protein
MEFYLHYVAKKWDVISREKSVPSVLCQAIKMLLTDSEMLICNYYTNYISFCLIMHWISESMDLAHETFEIVVKFLLFD